ncbi:hypothetical protein [Mycolicibacterium fluoranthenivorans]|uniref:hypothetical protein n=1 Tax=Mycolicibacterium fluoranthenivorans TaxID=258505 RepID=UPI001F271EEB
MQAMEACGASFDDPDMIVKIQIALLGCRGWASRSSRRRTLSRTQSAAVNFLTTSCSRSRSSSSVKSRTRASAVHP